MLSISLKSRKLQVAYLLFFTLNLLILTNSCSTTSDNPPAPVAVKDEAKGTWKVISSNTKYFEKHEYENVQLVNEINQDFSTVDYLVRFAETEVKVTAPGSEYIYPVDYTTAYAIGSQKAFVFNLENGDMIRENTVIIEDDEMTWITTEDYTDEGVIYKVVTTFFLEKI
ncbi:hypothetical protein C3K47_14565 [Solitalea longa]|uniref:Lipocalin-like domain-containing protein n=1 Tax=Solitalea longa TaxID=2079460 RepID=A0A2S4ZZ82_9SPHI|nr:hypothetical protein [Solitalea longa]POY35616.1 hypothetical protein C3K47_14565 [Solitalea longa]